MLTDTELRRRAIVNVIRPRVVDLLDTAIGIVREREDALKLNHASDRATLVASVLVALVHEHRLFEEH